MKLVICEKPSVAKTIAGALGIKEKHGSSYEGNGYVVSWCVGHLINFAEAAAYNEQYRKWNYEDLPIIPQEWKYVVSNGKEQQYAVLKDLMHRADITEVVNACDAGREGELIFRFVYSQAACSKPISRLWISSMEESAIRQGFENLKDGRLYENLYQSALCRSKADWLVGINATRLFSILYHKTLNVGRVISPTLNLLVERDGKISSFQKEKYHVVHIRCGGTDAQSRHISDASTAAALKEACEKSQAVCVSLSTEKKTTPSPKLYDLTSLQREANRVYGFTAKQTLDYAQTLYEKRLLTYPRTDSNYITADMGQTVTELVPSLLPVLPFMQEAGEIQGTDEGIKRIINPAKVTDHHAILPTSEFARVGFAGLAESEKKLLSLVCCRLLCAVSSTHEYEVVTATFECGGEQFTAKGRTIIAGGWTDIDRYFRLSTAPKKNKESNAPDGDVEEYAELPKLSEGQVFSPTVTVAEHYTTPPRPYTEDTLLSAMENAGKEDIAKDAERKGLGTPATRAGIIEKLLSAGFVERKGKSLVPTKYGVELAVILPDILKAPQLTADWESRLSEISKGNADPDEFMGGIANMIQELINSYSHVSDGNRFAPEKEVIGTCPRCGKNVYEGKQNYYCSDRGCRFVMWKNDKFFTSRKAAFSKKIATALLKNGKAKVKGLYSERTGKSYDATVILCDTGEKYVNYRIEVQQNK